ncbi:hypothetical protein J6590_026918 [Homalodisca vitripennis]|nr:hypothetical protein J6590_026918 [Homalodisca vitripennis]
MPYRLRVQAGCYGECVRTTVKPAHSRDINSDRMCYNYKSHDVTGCSYATARQMALLHTSSVTRHGAACPGMSTQRGLLPGSRLNASNP